MCAAMLKQGIINNHLQAINSYASLLSYVTIMTRAREGAEQSKDVRLLRYIHMLRQLIRTDVLSAADWWRILHGFSLS